MLLGLRPSQALLSLLLMGEVCFVMVCFSDWALQSFSAASLMLLALQASMVPSGAQLSATSINLTFGVLGLGGYGLMMQVWNNGAFL